MVQFIAKRIAFVVLGYAAAMLCGFAAFPMILAFIALFKQSSEVWNLLGLAPVTFVVAPIIFFIMMWVVVVFTFIPAAIFNLVAEIFGWRALWIYCLVALVLAIGSGLLLIPDWFDEFSTDRNLVTAAAGLSALLSGLVYWAIAGRNAGLREPLPA